MSARIILFCPPATVINGGIKQIFLLADTLRAQGFDAVVFEEQGRRPAWFPSSAPVVSQGVFAPRADEVLVLPEDQPQILKIFKDWPQRKVIYSQNHFYGSLSLPNGESFADYGAAHAICCSRTTLEHMIWRHPNVKPFYVPCGIDRSLFSPAATKKKNILYMPRKRPVEAAFIKDVFRYTYPECADWKWVEVHDKTEAEAARLMGEAKIFLALSRMESLGLTPLEAMACGCVVAGFTGLGGREFATPANGFWAEEDDFKGCAAQLRRAVDLALQPDESTEREAYGRAASIALANYTPEAFAAGAKEAFTEILGAI